MNRRETIKAFKIRGLCNCRLFLFFCFIHLVGNLHSQDDIRIRFVSVDYRYDDTVIVSWTKSTNPRIIEYEIQTYMGNPIFDFDKIATVDSSVTLYRHYNPNVNSGPQAYSVVPIYEGPERGNGTPPHQTMFLESKPDTCENKFLLSWTAYKGWDGPSVNLMEYQFYTKENDFVKQDFERVIIQINSTDTTYDLQFLPGTYNAIVKAVNIENRDVSYSTKVKLKPEKPAEPRIIFPNYATTKNGAFDISFSVYPDTAEANYLLFKYKENEFVDTIFLSKQNDLDSIIYRDTDVDTTKKYTYNLKAFKCGEDVEAESSPANNLVLEVIKGVSVFKLKWNTVSGWENGVEYFNLYRHIHGLDKELIYNGKSQSHTENIEEILIGKYSELVNGSGKFDPIVDICYYVEAVEKSNSEGKQNVCKSNTISAVPEIEPEIPDAFNPNDENPVNRYFKPVFTYVPKDYKLMIFNRWGYKVYEEQEYENSLGWDGTINSQPAPEGVYVYLIYRKDKQGNVKKPMIGKVILFYSKNQ